MASDQTKNAILTAAETLWAERSFGEVTMRDIVAAAGVNLAAVNYHFGSKDELLAELFIDRSTIMNRERFNELKTATEAANGKPSVEAILYALVSPPLKRRSTSSDHQRSVTARFMTRASVETVPPIKKIVDREFRHLQRFANALRLALPHRDEADIYWGLHFALAMIRQTVTDSERLKKLSGGLCDLNDTDDIIRRIVSAARDALVGGSSAATPLVVRSSALRKS